MKVRDGFGHPRSWLSVFWRFIGDGYPLDKVQWCTVEEQVQTNRLLTEQKRVLLVWSMVAFVQPPHPLPLRKNRIRAPSPKEAAAGHKLKHGRLSCFVKGLWECPTFFESQLSWNLILVFLVTFFIAWNSKGKYQIWFIRGKTKHDRFLVTFLEERNQC